MLIAISMRHRHIAAARFDCLLITTATLCGSPMLPILARGLPRRVISLLVGFSCLPGPALLER